MKFFRSLLVQSAVLIWILLAVQCTYYENDPPEIYKPRVPVQTDNLEASYVGEFTPNSINSPYWLAADYTIIPMTNITTGQVSSETGLLNVNGTYNGLSDFNANTELAVEVKAGYDDNFLYLLASWQDDIYDLSQRSWLFNGPLDPLKSETADGWTSQWNDDNIIFSFDREDGTADVWNWSLALSEPLGYALDMIDDGISTSYDAGERRFVRNVNGVGNTAGPKYEWSGEQQELTREISGFTLLDPGFYLLNKTEFTGNVVNGAAMYQAECAECHGTTGDGDGYSWSTGYAMNLPGFLNRFSREGLASAILGSSHDGASHFEKLNAEERNDLIAMIRGFSGVPGYYLENAEGTADVRTESNVALAKLNTRRNNPGGYKVLFIRELINGNADDIQFDKVANAEVNFDLLLTNNDSINTVGAKGLKLVFK